AASDVYKRQESLRDKRFRLGLDSILIGYYTDVGPRGEPEALIGLTLLGIGYRRYFNMAGPFYLYGEGGVEAFIFPYLEGGIIFATPFGMEFKMGIQLSLGIEEYTYGGETEYSFYPDLGIALGLGFRF
ncbi:MAG: hypothetical protein N2380_00930, partial [bacterium]|nr:hypothetical protein [bacterium]